MAFAICISFQDNIAPPTGDEVYIKYVEFNGEDETQYEKGIKKLDKTLTTIGCSRTSRPRVLTNQCTKREFSTFLYEAKLGFI